MVDDCTSRHEKRLTVLVKDIPLGHSLFYIHFTRRIFSFMKTKL